MPVPPWLGPGGGPGLGSTSPQLNSPSPLPPAVCRRASPSPPSSASSLASMHLRAWCVNAMGSHVRTVSPHSPHCTVTTCMALEGVHPEGPFSYSSTLFIVNRSVMRSAIRYVSTETNEHGPPPGPGLLSTSPHDNSGVCGLWLGVWLISRA